MGVASGWPGGAEAGKSTSHSPVHGRFGKQGVDGGGESGFAGVVDTRVGAKVVFEAQAHGIDAVAVVLPWGGAQRAVEDAPGGMGGSAAGVEVLQCGRKAGKGENLTETVADGEDLDGLVAKTGGQRVLVEERGGCLAPVGHEPGGLGVQADAMLLMEPSGNKRAMTLAVEGEFLLEHGHAGEVGDEGGGGVLPRLLSHGDAGRSENRQEQREGRTGMVAGSHG